MSKTVTGDFNELKRFEQELNNLSNSFNQSAQKAAKDLQTKALSQFSKALGPNNETWKPREDGQKAVQVPASQITFTATPNGITEHIPDVLKYHQETRPTAPKGNALPSPWEQTLSDSFEKSITNIIKPKK